MTNNIVKEAMAGYWWTDKADLVEDLTEWGFEVVELNDEYVVVVEEGSDETEEMTFYFGRARRTFWIER